MKAYVSIIALEDYANDTIDKINGVSIGMTAPVLISTFPQMFREHKDSFGKSHLQIIRFGGSDIKVKATNGTSGDYNPKVSNFFRLFGGRRKPKPKDE